MYENFYGSYTNFNFDFDKNVKFRVFTLPHVQVLLELSLIFFTIDARLIEIKITVAQGITI